MLLPERKELRPHLPALGGRIVVSLEDLFQRFHRNWGLPSFEEPVLDRCALNGCQPRVPEMARPHRPREHRRRTLEEDLGAVLRTIVEIRPLKVIELRAGADPCALGIEEHDRSGLDPKRAVGIPVSPLDWILDPVAMDSVSREELRTSNDGMPTPQRVAQVGTGRQRCRRSAMNAPSGRLETLDRPARRAVPVRRRKRAPDVDVALREDKPEVVTWIFEVGERIGPQAGLRANAEQILVRFSSRTIEDLAAALDVHPHPNLAGVGVVVAERPREIDGLRASGVLRFGVVSPKSERRGTRDSCKELSSAENRFVCHVANL